MLNIVGTERRKLMRIAIFSPNLSRKCSGGAETYALKFAEVLDKKHDVTIFTIANYNKGFSINSIYDKYAMKHFKTEYVNYIPTGHEHLKEIVDLLLIPMLRKIEKEYDMFINVTQNRVVAPKGIPSIHVIHFPDNNLDNYYPEFIAKKLNKRYADSYTRFLPNSKFTQFYFEKYWKRESRVVYAPITMEEIGSCDIKKKEKIILAVGRLVPDKKILEMIEAYKRLQAACKSPYKFVIIGAPNSKQMDYYNEIKEAIKDSTIELYSDLQYQDLVSWYKKAKIFWHAKGYAVDETNPVDMEHFGTTTVEAMINGCVPVVINKAGQKEIVQNVSQGYKWDTIEQLIEYTEFLINNEEVIAECSKNAIVRAKDFLMPSFEKELEDVIEETLKMFNREKDKD